MAPSFFALFFSSSFPRPFSSSSLPDGCSSLISGFIGGFGAVNIQFALPRWEVDSLTSGCANLMCLDDYG
jgi:hypothetical protein